MKKSALAFTLTALGVFGMLIASGTRTVRAQDSVPRSPSLGSGAMGRNTSRPVTQGQLERIRALRLADQQRRRKARAARPAGVCPGSVNSQGIYNIADYAPCMLDIDGTDYSRIQRAIDDAISDAQGGIIFFPSGPYTTSRNIVLSSGITIQGSNTAAFGGCVITRLDDKKKTPNQAVFEIDEGQIEISVKDIALQSDSWIDSVGIYIHGGKSTMPFLPDLNFLFNNISFNHMGKGIYVFGEDTLQEWQLETVKLENSFFGTLIGVHLDTHNTSWFMSSSGFTTIPGFSAIKLEKCGWITMLDLTGTAGPPPMDLRMNGEDPSTFIEVGKHQGVTVQGSATEAITNSLVVSWASRDNVITLINNRLQNIIDLTNAAQVTSIGNRYSADSVIVGSSTNVYSLGDRFCVYDGQCEKGDFVDDKHEVYNVAFRSGEFQRRYCPPGVECIVRDPKDPMCEDPALGDPKTCYTAPDYVETATNVPARFHKYVRIENGDPMEYQAMRDSAGTGLIPVLTVSSAEHNAKPLFRLGTNGFFYTYERDGGDGALQVQGSQEGYSSYRFKTQVSSMVTKTFTINNDGSITLQSTLFANLGSPAAGTMIYCSDCTQTSTCGGSGGGAFAKRIGSAWVCN